MKKIIFVIALVLILICSGCNKTPEASITEFDYLGVYPDWLEEAPGHNLELLDTYATDALKAVYLFRQACYNLDDIECYAYFLEGGGESVFQGANLTMRAQTVHIKNGGNSFHQMINFITEIDAGKLSAIEEPLKSFLLKAYQRIYYDGSRYYREGSNNAFDENDILIAAWDEFEVQQMGTPKTRDDYDTEEDYLNARYATETHLPFGKYTDTKLNSNNLVTDETTIETKYDDDGNIYYAVTMTIDISVANADTSTMAALKKDTGTKEVSYSEFAIEFEVWHNGLFKSLNPIEGW